jgi:hypothetical protein
MSLLRALLVFGLVLTVGVSVEGAQAGKKKKDDVGPVRGVITMVKANDTNDEGTVSIRMPDSKKSKDVVVNYIVNKETKIERAGGKAGAGTEAKFSDLKEDLQVILTPKEGAVGIAGKIQIVGTATRKKDE